MCMCRWLNSEGEVIETRTIREFAERFGMSVGVARQLHSGQRSRIRGFCSMAKRAKPQRNRFLTAIVNVKSGDRRIVGQSVRRLAEDLGLCKNELHKVLCGRKIMCRHWCLEKTWKAVNESLADAVC